MSDTAALRHEDAVEDGRRTRVAWLGALPNWLADVADDAFELVAVGSISGLTPRDPVVVHADADWTSRLADLRRAVGRARIVLDLSGSREVALRRRDAAQAALADLVLLGSLDELKRFRTRHPELAARTTVFRAPVDLARWAPERTLAETRSRDIKRLRRLHRLAGPIVLYVGPYTEAGGLARAIEAVEDIRSRNGDVRLVAVPAAEIDRRYLDRCERSALALGHHGIVEWTAEPADLPLWFALAAVVCVPSTAALMPRLPICAAAAGRPFVGTSVRPWDELVLDGTTGFLLETIDPAALVAAVEALVMDPDEADRIGAAAREQAEKEFSPRAALGRLTGIWSDGARSDGGRGAILRL